MKCARNILMFLTYGLAYLLRLRRNLLLMRLSKQQHSLEEEFPW